MNDKLKVFKEVNSDDRIAAWANGDDLTPLSPQEEELFTRADFAETLLSQGKPDRHIVERIVKKFDVSARTARNDITRAKRVFKPIAKIDKDYERSWTKQQYLKLYQMALEKPDIKESVNILNRIAELNQLNKPEEKGIDPALLGHNNYFLILNNGAPGEALKIDLDNIGLLHKNQVEKIQETINQEYIELESKILTDALGPK